MNLNLRLKTGAHLFPLCDLLQQRLPVISGITKRNRQHTYSHARRTFWKGKMWHWTVEYWVFDAKNLVHDWGTDICIESHIIMLGLTQRVCLVMRNSKNTSWEFMTYIEWWYISLALSWKKSDQLARHDLCWETSLLSQVDDFSKSNWSSMMFFSSWSKE